MLLLESVCPLMHLSYNHTRLNKCSTFFVFRWIPILLMQSGKCREMEKNPLSSTRASSIQKQTFCLTIWIAMDQPTQLSPTSTSHTYTHKIKRPPPDTHTDLTFKMFGFVFPEGFLQWPLRRSANSHWFWWWWANSCIGGAFFQIRMALGRTISVLWITVIQLLWQYWLACSLFGLSSWFGAAWKMALNSQRFPLALLLLGIAGKVSVLCSEL